MSLQAIWFVLRVEAIQVFATIGESHSRRRARRSSSGSAEDEGGTAIHALARSILAAGLGFGALAGAGFGLAAALVSTAEVGAAIDHRLESWLGREVEIGGKVRFSAFPAFAVSAEGLRVGPKEAPLVTVERLEGRLRLLSLLAGRVELASATIVRPRFALQADEAGALAALWTRVGGGGGGLGALYIRHGRIALGTPAGPRLVEGLKLAVVSKGRNEPIVAKGEFRYRGEQVKVRGMLARPRRLAAGRWSRVRLSASSARARISVDGRTALQPGLAFEGAFSASAPSLRAALSWLDLPPGEGRLPEAFALAGRLGVSRDVASLSEASLEIDGDRFEGAVEFGYEGARPVLQAMLDARSLDLDRWLAGRPEGLRLDSLTLLGLDGDIRLSAESVLLGGVTLGSTAAAIVMRDRLVEVTLGEMSLFGGTLSGRVTVTPSGIGVRMAAALRAEQVEIEPILRRLGVEASVSGRLDAAVSLSGQGTAWRRIVETLGGEARMRLTGGAIAGLTLAGGRIEGLAVFAGDALDAVSARFSVTNGVAMTQDLHIETSEMKASAAGSVSLTEGRIDLKGVAVSKSSSVAEAPFLLTGAWTKPVLLPDSGLAPSGSRSEQPVSDLHDEAGGSFIDRLIGRF